MNTTRRITGEKELLALTDAELECARGGWSISINNSFNTGANTQLTSTNSSFSNSSAYFGALTSNQGGFRIGGSAQSSNYYSVGIFLNQ